MRTTTSRGTLAATAIALALLVVACGNTSDGVDDANVPTTRGTVPVSGIPGNPSNPLPTGADICSKLTSDVVEAALGLDITAAEPTDPLADVAPGCTYSYTNNKGKPAAVTVVALRPLDMFGKTGKQGYKEFVAVNRALSQGVAFDEEFVNVGRTSVRFSGPQRHIAISDTGYHVLKVDVASADTAGAKVEDLLATVVGVIG